LCPRIADQFNFLEAGCVPPGILTAAVENIENKERELRLLNGRRLKIGKLQVSSDGGTMSNLFQFILLR